MLYITAIIFITAYLFVSYLGFRRACGQFRLQQRERVTRALGWVSPVPQGVQSGQYNPFVKAMLDWEHHHFVSRRREELHRQASKDLESSTRKIQAESERLSTWVIEENLRLQSSISRQLLLRLERSGTVITAHPIANWVEKLVRLRDQSLGRGAVAA